MPFLLALVVWGFVLIGCMPDAPEYHPPQPMTRMPVFTDFPVKRVYNGKPLPVNVFSHPRALHFQKRLVEAARTGPNFAGYYTVVRWDCGDECQQLAVIDARTGNVVFAPFTTHLGFRFERNSKLLIVDPPEAVERAARLGGRKTDYRTVYYVWEHDRFTEVYAVRYH